MKMLRCLTLVPILLISQSAFSQCNHYFSLVKQSPAGAVCYSQSVTLRAEYSHDINTPYVDGYFRWYTSSSGTTPDHSWWVGTDGNWFSDYAFTPPVGTTTIYVSFYDNLTGCETLRTPYEVTIKPIPQISQQYARACGDGIGKIQMTSPTPNVYYQLYKLVAGSYQYVTASPNGYIELTDYYGQDADKFYVTGTATPGCTPSNYYHISFDIQPDNLPPIIAGTTSYCHGLGTTLTASGGNGTFKWYNGSGSFIQESASLPIATSLAVGSYNYSVERISPGGCVTPRKNTTVTVKPRPQDGTITASATTICLGSSVTIYGSGGVGEFHYWCSSNGGSSWNIFSDSYVGQSSFSFTPATTGTFRFHLRNKTDCGFCWDTGNNGCPTYPYVDVTVINSVPGTTKSAATNLTSNTVYSNNFGATVLSGHSGAVLEWQYSFSAASGPYTGWGQQGLTTTSSTCCISSPGQTIWVRAKVQNGSCAVVYSAPTSYYWQSTPPVVNAGADRTVRVSDGTQTFTGSVTGGNGGIASYAWTKQSGPSATLANANQQSLSISNFGPGTYALRLTVTDNYGYTGSDDVVLTVLSTPPVVNAGPDASSHTEASTVTLTGTVSGGNGSITSYQWVKVSGPAATLNNSSTLSLSVSGFQPGTYLFRLTATDAFGYQGSDDASLTVVIANNYNYIKEYTILKYGVTASGVTGLTVDDKALSVTYFDGLGRNLQKVDWQASPSKNDMVLPLMYDDAGREKFHYLPYVAAATNGWYKEDALKDPISAVTDPLVLYRTGKQYEYYQPGGKTAKDQFPYSQTLFEPSPLNRVAKQGAPGQAWQPNTSTTDYSDRVIKKEYKTNVSQEVYLFSYNVTTGKVTISSTVSERYYQPNQLFLNKTFDEQNNEVIEYVDKEGRTVCKKVQYGIDTATQAKLYASTYYVFDDFGNLVVVLPPEAVVEVSKL